MASKIEELDKQIAELEALKRQRMAELETKRKQLFARRQKLESRENEKLGREMRKEDTRRKILLGALALEEMKENPVERDRILKRLDSFLSRPDDRALFKLPPLNQSALAPTKSNESLVEVLASREPEDTEAL